MTATGGDGPDVDAIADAIGHSPSRRRLLIGAAWSVPVIATAIATPAYASSHLPPCDDCVGSAGPPNCFISGAGGTCECAPGLVCVGTGPLGLANVCISTDLLNFGENECAGGTCYGLCLSPGSAVITAVNTFAAAASAFITGLGLVGGLTGLQQCLNTPGLPTNVCVSPFNDGRLGTLCSSAFACGGNVLVNTLMATLQAAYNTLISTLGSLGILVSPGCAAPYVCSDGVTVAADFPGLALVPEFAVKYQLGICQCPDDTPDLCASFSAAC